MTDELKDQALLLLRSATNNPMANFREGQWETISNLLHTKDRQLVVQRTGWGKSLVYFIATRLLRNKGAGPTLLISPLLALMRNQIAAATRINIKAATINSDNKEEWEKVSNQLQQGQLDILLISPERLANEQFIKNTLLPVSKRIGLFVVDEAHCISDWGHDFRPDYQRIVRILQALPPNIPILATTATANRRVIKDIQNQLGSNLTVSKGELTRKTLHLQNIYLKSPAERMAWLAANIPQLPGSGIIYTLTVKDAQRIADWLRNQKINAKEYYGGLGDDQTEVKGQREILENELLNNQIKVLVATTALGMGFDKPDLGFVIHYQRPGSVVHYYQQVGRAGRAIEKAYGILLNGEEDDDIIKYFIETSFPPLAHTQQVLNVLNKAENGLSLYELERELNLSNSQITKVLKLLSLESPAPIIKQGSKWYVTPINYRPNVDKIKALINIRRQEQQQIQDYMQSQKCLMVFLAEALDDPQPQSCGKCAVCLGEPLLSEKCDLLLVNQAIQYLQRSDQIIKPRQKWPNNSRLSLGSGYIDKKLQAEEGRALCLWGDAGWGALVRKGKYRDERFDDNLVEACQKMIQKWNPKPTPVWVTYVPSLKRPQLVADFAQRLAEKIGLSCVPVVSKVRNTQPQKDMNNSYQQAHNLDRAFQIDPAKIINAPVFLIDDFVDSRWTLTIITALLRQAGSGPVFPLALAINSLS